MNGEERPAVPIGDRLAFLLKHARERLAEISAVALEPFGINGRELAVLTVLGQGEPPSQLEAAQRLAVDRTTMVALVDALEGKGFVERRPDPRDRRRNIVVLTTGGQRVLRDASRATDEAEATFLAALPLGEADRLRALLQAIVGAATPERGNQR